jgi:hypothetical protein
MLNNQEYVKENGVSRDEREIEEATKPSSYDHPSGLVANSTSCSDLEGLSDRLVPLLILCASRMSSNSTKGSLLTSYVVVVVTAIGRTSDFDFGLENECRVEGEYESKRFDVLE